MRYAVLMSVTVLVYCGAVFAGESALLTGTITTDRIVYEPGASGTITATLKNGATTEAAVSVSIVGGLRKPHTLKTFTVPAGKEETVTLPFATGDNRWGSEVVMEAKAGGNHLLEREVFAIHDNIWAVAIMSGWPKEQKKWDTPEGAAEVARMMRDEGFTGCELYFWAECDMLDFTPETERFVGGQGGYPSTVTGTKNMIAAYHDQGMSATVYANFWGGSGRPSMEVMRQHPDWFGGANFITFVLDDTDLMGPWWDMQDAQVRAPGSHWNFANIVLSAPEEVYRLHARELVASHEMFGWDGVRYDSYYSRWWNVLRNRLVKRLVKEKVPEFQFGYNSILSRDIGSLALYDMVADGGLVMGEDVRIERIKVFGKYAKELLHWRDVLWGYGGHLGIIYNPDRKAELNQIWQCCILLAAGIHPYYNAMKTEEGDFPAFALRYSEYLYDNRMRALADPESVVRFDGKPQLLHWQDYARILDRGDGTYRLVLQLLNIPEDHKHGTQLVGAPPPVKKTPDTPSIEGLDIPEMKIPKKQQKGVPLQSAPVIENLPVTLSLPAGASVETVYAIAPTPEVKQEELSAQGKGNSVSLTVPEVRHWTMLVVEFNSPTPIPVATTLKEKTDTYLRNWHVAGPFPSDKEFAGLETAYPPEKGVDLAATYEGDEGKKVAWQDVRGTENQPLVGRPLDIGAVLNSRASQCAYAYTTVISDKDQDAFLYAKADDTLSLWVNGQPVAKEKMKELQDVPEKIIPVHLKKGENAILAKVCNKWAYWLLTVRVGDEQGRPLPSVQPGQ